MLLVALVVAPAAHARPASDIAGVAVHPWQLGSHDSRERVFSGVAATGAHWVRVDMPWAWVEEHGPTPRNGHGNWGAIDPIVESATRHGLKLLPIIGFTPEWASDSGDLWAYPYSQPFETFFAAARRRYPQIQAWELWNEPNFERFSFGGINAVGFVELLRAARHARDGVGFVRQADLRRDRAGRRDRRGVLDQPDRYPGRAQADRRPGCAPLQPRQPRRPKLLDDAAAGAPRSARRPGQADLPLWLTEYGAPTTPVLNGYAPPLTEPLQADRLRTAFALASHFDWIENLTWYEYRDSCNDKVDPECNFGLVHNDLSHKPSYDALREVIAGATAKLQPRLLLSTKIRAARVKVAHASKPARPEAEAPTLEELAVPPRRSN